MTINGAVIIPGAEQESSSRGNDDDDDDIGYRREPAHTHTSFLRISYTLTHTLETFPSLIKDILFSTGQQVKDRSCDLSSLSEKNNYYI